MQRAALAAALTLLAAAGPADGAAIDVLNAQRATNGIPAGIIERPDWSSACAKHDNYMALNNELTHLEDSSKPGYTEAGAWAGLRSVLASGSTWASGNVFETAPLHLAQLLAPQLSEMGQDESQGYVCDTTLPGMNRAGPDPPVVYTYPGDGATGWRVSEVANENPYVPGDAVGLPRGTRTGPHLYVLPAGGWDYFADAQITAASLTGPNGAAEVRWVDDTTQPVGPYLPPGGIVIPVAPLRRSATYTATVSLTVAGATLNKTWKFATVANQLPTAAFTVAPSAPRAGQDIVLRSTSTDTDGTIASQSWDVGDDGRIEGTGPSVTVRFGHGGVFTVHLRVTDSDGGTADRIVALAVAGRSATGAACAKLAARIAATRRTIRHHARDGRPKAQARRRARLRSLQRQYRTRCGA